MLLVLAAIGGNMVQHRLVWSAECLKPKFSKISPGAGFGRLFSKVALANFIKGLIKLALIGAVMTAHPVAEAQSARRARRDGPGGHPGD